MIRDMKVLRQKFVLSATASKKPSKEGFIFFYLKSIQQPQYLRVLVE